jgi:hypothetical protein
VVSSANETDLAGPSPGRGARRKRAFAPYGLRRSPRQHRVKREPNVGTRATDGPGLSAPDDAAELTQFPEFVSKVIPAPLAYEIMQVFCPTRVSLPVRYGRVRAETEHIEW